MEWKDEAHDQREMKEKLERKTPVCSARAPEASRSL